MAGQLPIWENIAEKLNIISVRWVHADGWDFNYFTKHLFKFISDIINITIELFSYVFPVW